MRAPRPATRGSSELPSPNRLARKPELQQHHGRILSHILQAQRIHPSVPTQDAKQKRERGGGTGSAAQPVVAAAVKPGEKASNVLRFACRHSS